jgi:hypothetical protein
MAESELDHAQGILRNILTLLIDQLTPTLELAKLGGMQYSPTFRRRKFREANSCWS